MRLSKLNLSSLPIIVFTSFVIVVGMSIMSSCGTKKHSVKDMRAAKAPYIPKPQEKAMVQPLFLQSKKANISLPKQSGGGAGGAITTEQVTYVNPDNKSDLFPEDGLDPDKTYGLSEVVVEARSRFTPERNGRIDVDFIVRAPKEVLSQNWALHMQPYIIGKDSIKKLDKMIIKGQQFSLKQKLDYQKYEDYLNSIVDKADYDSVFLDHDAIQRDIVDRQNFYYEKYHGEWSLHLEYEEWLKERERKDAEEKAKMRGQLVELKYEYARKALSHAVRDIAKGIDTTGIAASYNAEYMRKAASIQKRLSQREIGEMEIPKKYREIHRSKERAGDIMNNRMTSQDTINIAKNRYMFDAIVENEMKAQRKEQVFKEMVPFLYDKKARLDTTILSDRDFFFHYKQELPLSPGMKSVRITMQTKVVAVDQSKFTMPKADTLSYFVSSIAQLVDTTLLHKETVQKRNAFMKETAYFKYKPATWRFDINYRDNRAELNRITEAYGKFNEKGFGVDSIVMQASTSLAGEYGKNAELSKKRIEDLKTFFVKSTQMGQRRGADLFRTNYIGEDWNTLVRILRTRTDFDNKDQIIDILGNAQDPDGTEEEIKSLYKADYALLVDSIYPKLDKVDFLFNVHRKDMTQDIETIKVPEDYVRGVRLLQNREYDEALELLVNYPDYNTALCLAALGYNAKAYEVLTKLKSNGNIEYLSAMVAWRMQQEQAAVNHLLKAVELDPSKTYRLGLDPDINELVQKYNLRSKLNQMAN